jgi:TnpA family transposase
LPTVRPNDPWREFANSNACYGKPLFRGGIDAELIREQRDQLVRIASSLRQRPAPAQVVMQRLADSSPCDRVARALRALGRVVKSLYILRYLHE